MTAEETQQVQSYIANLNAEHARKLHFESQARKVAQADSLKMGQAMLEIWKLANAQSTITPQQFAIYVRQIINYYAPDFDIPF
jgi:hypothetical protein